MVVVEVEERSSPGRPCKSPVLLDWPVPGLAGLAGLAAISAEIGSADEDWLLISPEISR